VKSLRTTKKVEGILSPQGKSESTAASYYFQSIQASTRVKTATTSNNKRSDV